MTLDIRQVDPHDENDLRAWWEVGRDASLERPYDAWTPWEVSRLALPRHRTDVDLVLWLGEADGAAVASGLLVLPLADNTHVATVSTYVRPEGRRRGHGRALVGVMEERAAAAGRTTLLATVHAPVGGQSAGTGFAAALAYPAANAEETKILDLDTPPEWTALDEQVAAALGDYRVEVFEDRVPEEWADDFVDLLSAFMGLIPLGEVELEEMVWTRERLAEHEDRTAAIGEAWCVAVAIAPDGSLCGFTEAGISLADPRHAEVGGTMVVPAHQGHRLGLAMKLAHHRRLRELFPQCAYLATSNAGVNARMNAVNEQLGYRVVEQAIECQKKV